MPRRLRVLRVIARMNTGGPAQHIAALAALDPERFETVIVHGAPGEGEQDMADLLEGTPARVEYVPELGRSLRPWHDATAFAHVEHAVWRFRPHIVHTHTAKAGVLGRIAAASRRLPGVSPKPGIVHTFHGHVFNGYFGPTGTRLAIAAERAMARLTDVVLAISPRVRHELVEVYGIAPASKVRIVPLGLPLERFGGSRQGDRRQLRAELGVDDECLLIGSVGRLVPIKNLGLLLEAVHRAATAWRRNYRLVIVGGGESEPGLRAMAERLGLSANVVFLGWRRDLPAIYAGVDLVALSSDNEGTPVSLIEALASGLPVVATDVGGVSDVVDHGETGLLVPPRSAGALADAIETLAASPALRARFGAAGRARALARFGAAALLDNLAGLYDELAGRSATRPDHDRA